MLVDSTTPMPRRFSGLTFAIPYGVMIGAAAGCFLLIAWLGSARVMSIAAPSAGGVALPAVSSPVLHVLIALAAVMAVGRVISRWLHGLGQPPVIGEIVAGIVLGPSLLGWLAPSVSAAMVPGSALPYLNVVAQFGIILYMFRVGLELDWQHVRGRLHATVAISHASIIVPFVLGSALALALYPRLAGPNVGFMPFALFLGVAMSVTAFPVLARILTDRRLSRTPLGAVAMTCAAVDDVTAWCLLAFVEGVARARVSDAVTVVALTLLFMIVMWFVVRPLVAAWTSKRAGVPPTENVLALALGALLVSALTTEAIGLHAVYGAFLIGAIIPSDSEVAGTLSRQLDTLVTVLLLPAYFAITGMRTQIGLLSGLMPWLTCAAIIVVATVGKFGGTFVAARLCGVARAPAATLGVLMNTRGLMELIVLNIGLDLGVLSPELFSIMVVMTIVTTMATSPLVQVLS
jgi:Kef-type K+ transport system membrane component KefB